MTTRIRSRRRRRSVRRTRRWMRIAGCSRRSARVVIVQPTGYGVDNRCLLDALAAFGPQARGVATLPVDVSDAELARLHAAGVRGVRFMTLAGGLARWGELERVAARIAPLGWHVDVQLDGRTLPEVLPLLSSLPARVVIDHTGKFLTPVAPDAPAFLALRRLLDRGHAWVKLSAPYETSRLARPVTTMSRVSPPCWRATTRRVAYGAATGRTERVAGPRRPAPARLAGRLHGGRRGQPRDSGRQPDRTLRILSRLRGRASQAFNPEACTSDAKQS